MPAVLVTGAARGIGKTIVTHLGAAGWDVIAGVRSQADADALSMLPRVSTVLLDVTDDAQIAADLLGHRPVLASRCLGRWVMQLLHGACSSI